MRKRKELPSRIFHKIWDAALKSSSREEYLYKYATISTTGLKLGKYNLNDRESFDVVLKVYELSHKRVKDIANDAGLKKSEMGHLFCVPKRTLEEWYKEDRRCPPYIKLFMLRQLGQFDIGKDIHVTGFGDITDKTSDRSRRHGVVRSAGVSARQADDNLMRLVGEEYRNNVAESIEIRKLLEQTEHIGKVLSRRTDKGKNDG